MRMTILTCPSFETLHEMFTVRTKYGGLVVKVATPIAILAGVFIAWPYVRRSWGKNKTQKVLSRSMSLASLHGGKLALERLVDYHHARADASTLESAEIELRSLLSAEYHDYNKLQSNVAKLEMSGKEEVAIQMLEREMENSLKEGKPHEAYEIGMLLVEMYIYKGEFKKALQCDCLSHKEIYDARRPLYKAILHLMMGNPEVEARKCWEEFKDIRAELIQLSSDSEQGHQLHRVITDFVEFKKVVNLLKTDISKASYKKVKRQ